MRVHDGHSIMIHDVSVETRNMIDRDVHVDSQTDSATCDLHRDAASGTAIRGCVFAGVSTPTFEHVLRPKRRAGKDRSRRG
jgi:hypothetical protein